MLIRIALGACLMLALGARQAGAMERVLRLDAPDMDQRVLLAMPETVRGIIVMLPGGSGELGLSPSGTLRHGDNFVVRTRALWLARGYGVLIPDSDEGSLRGRRSKPAYAALVERLVEVAHRQASGPVFLLGTSQGAIAAMNGAAHATPGSLAGLVLSEAVSVMGGSGETVFDADPARVDMPALVVANRDDRCDVAPPDAAPRIAAAMRRSPDARVLTVSGGAGDPDSPCGSLGPHGYHGIETQVVAAIADWMDAHGG